MYGKETREDFGVFRHTGKALGAQPGPALQCKQEGRHPARPLENPPVRALVKPQVPGLHRLRKSSGLPEGERQPFARNRIHRTRGIAQQGNAGRGNPFEPPRNRERSPLRRTRFNPFEPAGRGRKFPQTFFQPELRVARKQRDTDLVFRNRCDIELASLAPVHLYMVTPGRNGVVAPEPIANLFLYRLV